MSGLIKFDGRTYMGKVYKKLKDSCKDVVEKAIDTHEFENRTHNLEDSYGAAVYYDGMILPETIYYKSPKATERKKWKNKELSGHEEMIKYLMKFKPRKKGFTLVLVAAMPYGEILERGGGNLRRKYQVIVGANKVMQELANDLSGMFGRRRGARTSINVEKISK